MQLLKLNSILLALDADEPSPVAIVGAAALASAAGAMLHAVHVIRDHGTSSLDEEGRKRIRDRLASLVEPHMPLAGAPGGAAGLTCHVEEGEPGPTIRHLATRVGAAAIVLGPHRPREGPAGSQLGSTGLDVAVQSNTPCLILQGELRLPLTSILVSVDLSKHSDEALSVALTWASALRSPTGTALRFDVVHVRQSGADPDARFDGALAGVRSEAGSWAGVAVHGGIVDAPTASAGILERAGTSAADLIVMGRRGQTTSSGEGVGSVAADVVLRSDRPVLLVPLRARSGHAPAAAPSARV